MNALRKFMHVVPLGILLFLFFFSVYSFTVYGRLRYGDETERYLQAESLVERQTFAIRRVPAHEALGADGKTYYSQFELGYGLLLVPFFTAGKLLSQIATFQDPEAIPIVIMSFANPILTALTCVLLFRFNSRLGVGVGTAVGVTMIYGLATLAWPYTRGLYREAMQAFTLLFAVYAIETFRQEQGKRWILFSGLGYGYLVFTKVSNLVMLPVFLGYLLLIILEQRKQTTATRTGDAIYRSRLAVSLFLLPLCVLLVIQGIVNLLKFGNFFDIGPYNYRDPFPFFSLSTLASGIWGLLFSVEKGLVLYAPPIVLFILSWTAWFRKNRLTAMFVLVLVLTNIVYNGAYRFWEGGTYWGTRYLVLIVPLMLLPFGMLMDEMRGWKRLVLIAFAGVFSLLGLGVQIIGAFVGDRDYLDVTGQWIAIAGAWDLLRNGALDSLFVYLSPQPPGLEINPYGQWLIVIAFLLALWIVARTRTRIVSPVSMQSGSILLVSVWLISLLILITQVFALFQGVKAMQGNTRFVAAETFFEQERYCEAENLYGASLFFDTQFAREAQARIMRISPSAPGENIEIGDLAASVEIQEGIDVTYDSQNVLSESASLRIGASDGKIVTGSTLTEFIPLSPSTRYELSGWLKSLRISEGAAVIGWYEDNGRWGNPKDIDIASMSHTNGWQLFRQAITTQPTTRRGMIKVGLWHATGTLWIEGVLLVKVDEQLSSRGLCNR